MNKAFLLVSAFLFCLTGARAQMLSGSIADTVLSKKVYLTFNPERGGSRFDGISKKLDVAPDGSFSFSTDRVTTMPFCPAYLYLGDDSMWGLLIQPGKKLKFKAYRKNGKTVVDYDGDNREAASFVRDYLQWYDYDTFFPFDDKDDKMATNEKQALLKKYYDDARKELRRVKDKAQLEFLTKVNDDAFLNFSLRLSGRRLPERKDLLCKITVNDWRSLYNYLPQRVVESRLPAYVDSLWGHDTSMYGVEYMKAMKTLVTDPDVKHALLDGCARETLNYGNDYADIDVFWKPFCDYADSMLIRRYASKVDAIKRTKAGMMATDFGFEDPEGKLHRLSDFRGKTVYIDCWATWCGPCCAEIPHLEKRVEEFKDDDRVVFISISVDENIKAWQAKLAKDKPQWPQFRVNEQQNDSLSRTYGISAIPRFMVINADGTIATADAFRPSDANFSARLRAILDKQTSPAL